MKKKEHKKQGKKNRAAGARFELKVRKDLEEKDWIVSKWMNNVRVDKDFCGMFPAKHKFRGPGIPMSIGTGFPDFIAFRFEVVGPIVICNKELERFDVKPKEIIGVEVKSDGYLDKIEKEKCRWLLDNHIFSKILIAQKGEKRGEIIYKEFSQ